MPVLCRQAQVRIHSPSMKGSITLGLVSLLAACSESTITRDYLGTGETSGGSSGQSGPGGTSGQQVAGTGAVKASGGNGVGETAGSGSTGATGGTGAAAGAGGVGAAVGTGGTGAGSSEGATGGLGGSGGGTFPLAGSGGSPVVVGNGGVGSVAGTGGVGSVVGTGGAAGAPHAPCSVPSDCGATTDGVHCECFDSGAGKCAVRGKDGDADGHRDSGCKADTTADDCDDGQKTVYPGAKEFCDGLDNDCDGLGDLEDGFALGGTAKEIIPGPGAQMPMVRWIWSANAYGLVWNTYYSTSGEWVVWYQKMDSSGTLVGQPFAVGRDNLGHSFFPAAMAAGKEDIAVLYRKSETSSGKSLGLYFQRVHPTGGFLGNAVQLTTNSTGNASVAQSANGSWYAFWSETNSVQGVQLDLAGGGANVTSSGVVNSGGRNLYNPDVRAVPSGGQVGMVYSALTGVYWNYFSSSVSAPQDVLVASSTADVPDIALGGSSTGYALAWSADSTWQFREMMSDGTLGCGPVALPSPATGGKPTSVASHGSLGWLMGGMEWDAAGKNRVGLQVISANCKLQGGWRWLTESPQMMPAPYRVELAVGVTSTVAVWPIAGGSNGLGIFARSFGPNLCDEAR